MGFLACVALIAAAISKDDLVVLAQVTNSVFVCVIAGIGDYVCATGCLFDIVLRCRMAPSASIPRQPANHSRIQRWSVIHCLKVTGEWGCPPSPANIGIT